LTFRAKTGTDVDVWYYSDVNEEDASRLCGWNAPVKLYVGGKKVLIESGMAFWVSSEHPTNERERKDLRDRFNRARWWMTGLLGKIVPGWG
jgi:hypothetical protein